MTLFDLLVRALPVLLALAATLLLAKLAGIVAARFKQPSVVAEIAAGILIGATVGLGSGSLHRLLPQLRLIGEAGLILFLVGVAYEIRSGLTQNASAGHRREAGSVAVAAIAIPQAAGLLLAGWVVVAGGPGLRGTAPTASLLLMVAVALGLTAVPVLARILADRNMLASPDGRLAMTAAIFIDAASWPLVAVAVAIRASADASASRPLIVIAIAIAGSATAYLALRTTVASWLFVRAQETIPVLIGLGGLVAGAVTEHYGLTEILGAVLVGLVIPPARPDAPWSDSVRAVARWGRFLTPAYFVVVGVTVVGNVSALGHWPVVAAATVLALTSKVGGGYLGSRLCGRTRESGLRVGVLMSTRGLTEIVVLQAGYSAAILTTSLYSALVIMALVTTMLTVPLLSVIDRWYSRSGHGQVRKYAAPVAGNNRVE